MSDLHVDSSFYKQSMKIDNYLKIMEWIDSSIGELTVIQELKGKRPKLSNLNQTQSRRRYVNFENSSHFICSLNLNSPQLTIFIVFRMTNIASGDQEIVNSLIGNSYVTIADDGSSSVKPDLKFPSSKSNRTDLNKWHVISVTWSNKGENLSNCWSNGEKLITFTTGNINGSDHCYIYRRSW